MYKDIKTNIDPIVVIGGGHAGIEAAYAASRFKLSVVLVTLKSSSIGQMSCNPAIGGLGKGQIVKEIDALGGAMPLLIDRAGIQFRLLNSSKGPAVRSSRAQADRDLYKKVAQEFIANRPNIKVVEGEVVSFLIKKNQIKGVYLRDGQFIPASALVVTTGTFLRGLMHCGEKQVKGGRIGDKAANNLSQYLHSLGFKLIRLKTGTPPRLDKNTINFQELVEQKPDPIPRPFSITTDKISQAQISCWITSTNEEAHSIIYKNKDKSPMYNGQINAIGPRYCPSIEDKVFRFADKPAHNIFLEPEGYNSNIVYPNGISTSLPVEVQEQFVHKIKGLEYVKILEYGYAVEYDAIEANMLKPTLESKDIENLFFAGQINGTSGYEEAAGQGIVAGINSALAVLGQSPFILSRTDAYIGVMIDDLTTVGVDEPYRMFTSRAEYRLILREDNAALRLTPKAIELGIISKEHNKIFNKWRENYNKLYSWLDKTKVKPDTVNNWLCSIGTVQLKEKTKLSVLLKRPEVTLNALLGEVNNQEHYSNEIITAVETEIKFSGYLRRQEEDIARLRKAEGYKIPHNFSYDSVPSLRTEIKEKLKRHRPINLAQALNIPGVTPSAVSLLAIFLKKGGERGQKIASQ